MPTGVSRWNCVLSQCLVDLCASQCLKWSCATEFKHTSEWRLFEALGIGRWHRIVQWGKIIPANKTPGTLLEKLSCRVKDTDENIESNVGWTCKKPSIFCLFSAVLERLDKLSRLIQTVWMKWKPAWAFFLATLWQAIAESGNSTEEGMERVVCLPHFAFKGHRKMC